MIVIKCGEIHLRNLTVNEITKISAGICNVSVQRSGEFGEIMSITLNGEDSVLMFNNLTFTMDGCYFNGALVNSQTSYSGYNITTNKQPNAFAYGHPCSLISFELKPTGGN